jgi:TPR repeat protein
MLETIECVACAEAILSSAKLCKHCGTMQNDQRFQPASVANEGTDLVDRAIELFQDGDFAKGLELIAPLVKAGDPNALANAGWANHEMGDDKTALKLLKPAAEKGHLAAMWNIVTILDVEGCTKAERNTYRAWLVRLAELEDTGAMLSLYEEHLDQGEKDEALDWLNKAAAAGNADALRELKTWKVRPLTYKFPKVSGSSPFGLA